MAVALTPYALLTGNHTAEGYDGKTWRLTQAHTVNDKLVNSDASFSLLDEDIPSLPAGAFSVYVGLPEAYNDEFTFYHDGRYRHNTTDGVSFGGILFASLMQELGKTQITKTGGKAVFRQDVFATPPARHRIMPHFCSTRMKISPSQPFPILLPAQGLAEYPLSPIQE